MSARLRTRKPLCLTETVEIYHEVAARFFDRECVPHQEVGRPFADVAVYRRSRAALKKS